MLHSYSYKYEVLICRDSEKIIYGKGLKPNNMRNDEIY